MVLTLWSAAQMYESALLREGERERKRGRERLKQRAGAAGGNFLLLLLKVVVFFSYAEAEEMNELYCTISNWDTETNNNLLTLIIFIKTCEIYVA